MAQITRHRDKSRRPLRKLFRTLEADDWPGRVARLRRRLRNLETDETFAAFAGRRLPSFLERFFARADRRLADADELHSLRVAGKKLRYGLEVLGVALPRAVRTAGIAVLTEMQESLGGFVDHATAADRFHRWARKSDAGSHRRMLASLAEREARMADKARRRFVRWWTSSRRRSLRRSFQPTSRRTMT